ncbi:MAG: outer membrane protein transport protein [Rhizomicrobium sp.]
MRYLTSRPYVDSEQVMRRSSAALCLLFIFAATPAVAAGYGLKEESADAMAAAYAGSAATSSDASYLAYNPASLAGVEGTDFAVSGTAILPGSRGHYTTATTSAGNPTGGGTKPSGFISDALVPAFAVRHRLDDQWAVGLDISAPWGLRTDYPAGWAGRYYAQKTELLTINATPSVSWQPLPGVALGAGLQIEYAQATLDEAIDTGTLGASAGIPGSIPGHQDSFAHLSGKSWTFGFTAGAIVNLTDDLTAGLSYRSSLQHDLKGPIRFTLDGAGIGATIRTLTGAFQDSRGVAPLTMPDMITGGLTDRLSDDWSVMAELDWTHWSRFRALTITVANPAQPPDVTSIRWNDAVFASLGAEYRFDPSWTFRAGVAYDESPTPDATREPRIPDADRFWLSAGVRYKVNDRLDLNITAARLIVPASDVTLNPAIPGAAARGTLVGSTDSYVNVVGFQMSYRAD